MYAALCLAISLAAPFASAQSGPSFEVASIKPSPPGTHQKLTIEPGGRFSANEFSLQLLITIAYHLTPFQMEGAEPWMASDRWNIDAIADGVTPVPDWVPPNIPEVIAVRLRALLEDRFALEVHRETRTRQVYSLTAARGGSKLIRAGVLSQGAGSFRAGPGVVIGTAVTMNQIVAYLNKLMDRQVTDNTGITGVFDIRLQFAPDSTPRSTPPPADGSMPEPPVSTDPSIFTALQEQLGLKLELTKEPGEVIVIDSARKPIPN